MDNNYKNSKDNIINNNDTYSNIDNDNNNVVIDTERFILLGAEDNMLAKAKRKMIKAKFFTKKVNEPIVENSLDKKIKFYENSTQSILEHTKMRSIIKNKILNSTSFNTPFSNYSQTKSFYFDNLKKIRSLSSSFNTSVIDIEKHSSKDIVIKHFSKPKIVKEINVNEDGTKLEELSESMLFASRQSSNSKSLKSIISKPKIVKEAYKTNSEVLYKQSNKFLNLNIDKRKANHGFNSFNSLNSLNSLKSIKDKLKSLDNSLSRFEKDSKERELNITVTRLNKLHLNILRKKGTNETRDNLLITALENNFGYDKKDKNGRNGVLGPSVLLNKELYKEKASNCHLKPFSINNSSINMLNYSTSSIKSLSHEKISRFKSIASLASIGENSIINQSNQSNNNKFDKNYLDKIVDIEDSLLFNVDNVIR